MQPVNPTADCKDASSRGGSWLIVVALLGVIAAVTAFRSDTPDDDDEEDHPHQHTHGSTTAAQAAAGGSSSAAQAAAATQAAVNAAIAKLPATPRLRTRLFAAEQLLSLFAAVGSDSRHRHLRPKYGAVAGVAEEGQTGRLGHMGDCCCIGAFADAACLTLLFMCMVMPLARTQDHRHAHAYLAQL